jgi:2'-5' RNA ligase
MPRIFTGVEIPAEVVQSLSLLRGGIPGARWIDPENYHLTLRFMGDVDHAIARDVMLVLGAVKRRHFEIALNGLEHFGGKKPRAVIAMVAANGRLAELQAEHERILQRIGLPPEQRKFTPHVTLARLRDTSSREVADYLSVRGAFKTLPFSVTRFVLFSSRASVGGGPYVIEAAYPLQ